MSNRSTIIYVFLVAYLSIGLVGCTPKEETFTSKQAFLTSWHEGATKNAIMSFVEDATDPKSDQFIPVGDRIATFDNDGTLWSEKPFYFQLFFVIDRIKANAEAHPEWNEEEPYRSVLANDIEGVFAQGEEALLALLMGADADVPVEEFYDIVEEWLADAKHPRFDRPFNELVYQPMIELMDYLRANDFKVFIVSGGGIDFMRPWVTEVYGVPVDQVVGSNNKMMFSAQNGRFEVLRQPKLEFLDDKDEKPVGIMRNIGKRPVFAAGNSDGDLAMLQFTSSNEKGAFMLYIHHTDAEREWAYDRQSSVGRLDKGLDEASSKGWTVVDMKADWKVVYPFEMNENE